MKTRHAFLVKCTFFNIHNKMQIEENMINCAERSFFLKVFPLGSPLRHTYSHKYRNLGYIFHNLIAKC